MTGNKASAGKAHRRDGFAHGDRVRVVRGTLAGLTGVVTRLSSRFDCVLAIDGWPHGAYLLIVGDGLEFLEREARSV